MKNRNVKCFSKEKRPTFLSSGGGNHLDQSVLWHRDVIELLMSLNEITCDLVAGSFHSGATVLFPKLLEAVKMENICCSWIFRTERERKKWGRKHHDEQKVTIIKAEGRVLRQGCVAFCGVTLVYHPGPIVGVARMISWEGGVCGCKSAPVGLMKNGR